MRIVNGTGHNCRITDRRRNACFFALWGRPVALKDIKVGPVGQKNVPLWLRTSHMGTAAPNPCSAAGQSQD